MMEMAGMIRDLGMGSDKRATRPSTTDNRHPTGVFCSRSVASTVLAANNNDKASYLREYATNFRHNLANACT